MSEKLQLFKSPKCVFLVNYKVAIITMSYDCFHMHADVTQLVL